MRRVLISALILAFLLIGCKTNETTTTQITDDTIEIDQTDNTDTGSSEIILYGRPTCGICAALQSQLDLKKIKYTYKNIDTDTAARDEMWKKVYASSWYSGGSVGLPIVDVMGEVYMRPTIEQIEAQIKRSK